MVEIIYILLLILVANASPVFVSYLFSHRQSLALDFGHKLRDQQYIFGRTKTWRGLTSSLIITSLVSLYLSSDIFLGIYVATLAMLGDLFSSFIKRRRKMQESSKALLLDQIPESLFPALGVMHSYQLELTHIIAITLSFTIIDLILSQIFFKLGIRKRPY